MPPKPIVDKENVISAALTLTQERGIEHVNARNLAEILGCSTKPLFRLYRNMEELKSDLFFHMNRFCSDYLLSDIDFEEEHTALAVRYISFARQEPNIFKALFMKNAINHETIANMPLDKEVKLLINHISKKNGLSNMQAKSIYTKMWLLSHGIASLIATNLDTFGVGEAEQILVDAYSSFVLSETYGRKTHESVN